MASSGKIKNSKTYNPLDQDSIQFAFLRSFIAPKDASNKATSLKPLFEKKSQVLRPFVSIMIDGVKLTDIPYEHVINFEYQFGLGSNFGTVKLSFFDQTIWFVERLLLYAMNENKEISFQFGWFVDDARQNHSSQIMTIWINIINYEFSRGGVIINIEGVPKASKILESFFIEKAEFNFEGIFAAKEKLPEVAESKTKQKETAENNKMLLGKRTFANAIRTWISTQYKILANTSEDLDFDVIIDESVVIRADAEQLKDKVIVNKSNLLEAIRIIFKHVIIQDAGEVKIIADCTNRYPYKGTLRISVPESEKKAIAGYRKIASSISGIDSVIAIVNYPAAETPVISFTPSYNSWMLWFRGYKVNYPEANPQAGPGLRAETPAGKGKVSGFDDKSNAQNVKQVEANSETDAQNIAQKGTGEKGAMFATARLSMLGEPKMDSVGWLFKRIGIIINHPPKEYYLKDSTISKNFRTGRSQFTSSPYFNFGIDIESPWNGVWQITKITHTIGTTETFTTELELQRIDDIVV